MCLEFGMQYGAYLYFGLRKSCDHQVCQSVVKALHSKDDSHVAPEML